MGMADLLHSAEVDWHGRVKIQLMISIAQTY